MYKNLWITSPKEACFAAISIWGLYPQAPGLLQEDVTDPDMRGSLCTCQVTFAAYARTACSAIPRSLDKLTGWHCRVLPTPGR